MCVREREKEREKGEGGEETERDYLLEGAF